jgi:hypothetical protein
VRNDSGIIEGPKKIQENFTALKYQCGKKEIVSVAEE